MPAPIVPVVATAIARLVAKHGAKTVQRALQAANKPAKGKTAAAARKRGAQYQAGVNKNIENFKNIFSSPGNRAANPKPAVKSDKASDAMRLRNTIAQNRAKNKSGKRGR